MILDHLSLVDHWHILEALDVISLNHKDCAADLDDVIDLQRVQAALLSF